MTVQELIDALSALDEKDMPVCVFDSMDLALVKEFYISDRTYWDGTKFQTSIALEIQGH